MTKAEFKTRWESSDDGGGLTFEDIAECAKAWGIAHRPRIEPIFDVRYKVLVAAGVSDADEYKPRTAELEDEIYRLAQVNTAFCATEASPAHNMNLMSDYKIAIYRLALELRDMAADIAAGETITPERLARMASYAEAWDRAKAMETMRKREATNAR